MIGVVVEVVAARMFFQVISEEVSVVVHYVGKCFRCQWRFVCLPVSRVVEFFDLVELVVGGDVSYDVFGYAVHVPVDQVLGVRRAVVKT